MIKLLLLSWCLTACSDYTLSDKEDPKEIEDVEEIIDDTDDTNEPSVDTSTIDTGDILIEETAVVATCAVAPNPVTPPFTAATFDGSGSYDSGGNVIAAYNWELIELPEGSAAILPYTSGMTIGGFYADLAGDYVAQLTVTNELGDTDICQTTLEAIPAQSLWIEMFWQYAGDDMDLHLLAPGGTLETNSDCYYANCSWSGLDWGIASVTEDNPSLDIDDISGTGPENINIYSPQIDGVYTVYVHDYPGSVYAGSNEVTINIYLNGSIIWSATKAITVEDSYTPYAIIDWANQSVTPL
ncbi:MAG: hypothetical protein H8E97_06705 [Bacteroidetes bacterium]|nr:hypothetical protein [Bacteroidota bacterium]